MCLHASCHNFVVYLLCMCRWRLVIHGCIDGYSRLVTYLQCSPNNLSETAFGETYLQACCATTGICFTILKAMEFLIQITMCTYSVSITFSCLVYNDSCTSGGMPGIATAYVRQMGSLHINYGLTDCTNFLQEALGYCRNLTWTYLRICLRYVTQYT